MVVPWESPFALLTFYSRTINIMMRHHTATENNNAPMSPQFKRRNKVITLQYSPHSSLSLLLVSPILPQVKSIGAFLIRYAALSAVVLLQARQYKKLPAARSSDQAKESLCVQQQLNRVRHHGLPAAELALVQIGVEAALGEQLLVGTLLDDGALVHDQNQIGIADRR